MHNYRHFFGGKWFILMEKILCYYSVSQNTSFGTTASLAIGQQKRTVKGNTTATSGDSQFYLIVSKPLDGLTISTSYMKVNKYRDGSTEEQVEQGGAAAKVQHQ